MQNNPSKGVQLTVLCTLQLGQLSISWAAWTSVYFANVYRVQRVAIFFEGAFLFLCNCFFTNNFKKVSRYISTKIEEKCPVHKKKEMLLQEGFYSIVVYVT